MNHWLKLKLPEEVILSLTNQFSDILQLVFSELENTDENLENATTCIIELINLAKKNQQYSAIKEAVIVKIEKLVTKVERAVE